MRRGGRIQDKKLDRLFERFRARGDAGALGEVFDRASPELLRVAMYLTRGPAAAEDLLHATFLTAIGRARHYDEERRRELLPAGLALGGAPIVTGGRGKAAVRANVLRAATEALPWPVTAAVPALPTLIGGILVTKKALLAALLVLLFAGLAWILRDGGGKALGEDLGSTPALLGYGKGQEETGARLPASRTGPEPAPEPAREAVAPPVAAPSAYTAALSGVRGRLVELDGRAAADQEVRLLELSIDEARIWLGAEPAGIGASAQNAARARRPLELELSRTRTDAEGRFLLRGARARALHALSGGVTSPRVPLRLIGEPLVPGELVDIGDIVLPPRTTLRGRVVDEGGNPLPGARVRAGSLPDMAFALGLEELRTSGCALLAPVADPPIVVELPAWVPGLLDLLDLAVAHTDAEGRFVLADLAAGTPDVVVDLPGRVTRVFPDVPLEAAKEHDLGAVTLARGSTLRGFVREADGTPVAGARLFAGRRPEPGQPPRVLVGGVASDAAGHFELHGLTPDPALIVACQPDPWSPWIVQPAGDLEECSLRVPARGNLALLVRDERGNPVAGARLRLAPDSRLMTPGLIEVAELGRRVSEPRKGTLVIEGLAQGTYDCWVGAEGFATTRATLALDEPAVERTIILSPPRTIVVSVVDDATSAPVAEAIVSLTGETWQGQAMGSARTDANGRGSLGLRSSERGESSELCLRAEHPAYATAFRRCKPDTRSAELRLSAGGALAVRLVPLPAADEPWVLSLYLMDAGGWRPEELELVRLDPRGQARLTHLTPGRYRYELLSGWKSAASLLALLGPDGWPEDVERGDFEVRAAETTELEIRRSRPPGANATLGQGTGTVEGRILIDGQPAQGLIVSLQGPPSSGSTSTSLAADGSYRFLDVPAGELWLTVETARDGKRYVTEPQLARTFLLELASGETRRLDLDWASTALEVRTVDQRGWALPGIPLTISAPSTRISVWTDSSGQARVSLPGPGSYLIEARHEKLGVGRARVGIEEGQGLEPITIELSTGVPCAGRVRCEAPGKRRVGLVFRREGEGIDVVTSFELTDGQGAFRAVGLEPGRYRVHLFGLEEEFQALELELGASGDEALELAF